MKKKIIMLLTVFAFIFSGCGTETVESQENVVTEEESQENTTIDDTVQESDNDPSEENLTSESENNESENSEVDSEDAKNVVCTDLFESIYAPYANREKSFIFNDVKEFIQTTDYEQEITEPTANDLGTIKLLDENGDYVFFAFNPVNGIEIIMSVSYYHDSTNSEVSLSNYSTDGSPKYDTFSTHVLGESETKVYDLEEQKNFLFSN